MEQAIYGDLYFAVNFTMDTLALFLTAKMLRQPVRPLRLAAAGALGAVYSVGALLLPDGNPLAFISALLMPCLICLAALGWQNARAFLKGLAAFWTISLLLGGIMTAVCYGVGVWGKKQVSVGGKVQPLLGDLPFWGILLFALLAGALISWALKRRKPTVQTVDICIEEQTSICLKALVDSGNLLTEPLSGLPVIVVDRESAAAFLPAELSWLAAPNGPSDKKFASASAERTDVKKAVGWTDPANTACTDKPPNGAGCSTVRLRLIPCTTASGEGILYGFVPRRVLVAGRPKNACVAIGRADVSHTGYAAIIPSNLL